MERGWGQGLARMSPRNRWSILKMVRTTNVLHLLMLNVGKLSGQERQLDCLEVLNVVFKLVKDELHYIVIGFRLDWNCRAPRRVESASMVSAPLR